MKLMLDYKITRNLQHTLRNLPPEVKRIRASIAYNYEPLLIRICQKRQIDLDLWGLFTAEISTDVDIIQEMLQNPRMRFFPIVENFHPKLIYFENFGIYVGSANMTEKALYNNVEAGVFLSMADLQQSHQLQDIEEYFNELRQRHLPINEDDFKQFVDLQNSSVTIHRSIANLKNQAKENFKEAFGHLFLSQAPTLVPQDKTEARILKKEKSKLEFLREWRETQGALKYIRDQITKDGRRPIWVNPSPEWTVVTDQFLHAYYYQQVLHGHRDADEDFTKSIILVEQRHTENRNRREDNLREMIDWWNNLPQPPGHEADHINIWASENKRLLSAENLLTLVEDDFVTILQQNHAARNHAKQIPRAILNIPDGAETSDLHKTEIFARQLFAQHSADGTSTTHALLELLHAETPSLEERVYNLLRNENKRIPRLGRSIVGELCGWGRPDIAFLRNNRVNKGLRALGFDIHLYGPEIKR